MISFCDFAPTIPAPTATGTKIGNVAAAAATKTVLLIQLPNPIRTLIFPALSTLLWAFFVPLRIFLSHKYYYKT